MEQLTNITESRYKYGSKSYVQCSYCLLFFIDTPLLPNRIPRKNGALLTQAYCWGNLWNTRPMFHVEYSTVSGDKGKHLLVASTFWCARSTPTTIQIGCDTKNTDGLLFLLVESQLRDLDTKAHRKATRNICTEEKGSIVLTAFLRSHHTCRKHHS